MVACEKHSSSELFCIYFSQYLSTENTETGKVNATVFSTNPSSSLFFLQSLDIPSLESTDESSWIAFDSALGWTLSSLLTCFPGIHTLGLVECMVNVFKPQTPWDWGYYSRYGLKQNNKNLTNTSCQQLQQSRDKHRIYRHISAMVIGVISLLMSL